MNGSVQKKFFEVFFGDQKILTLFLYAIIFAILSIFSSDSYLTKFNSKIDNYSILRGELYREIVSADSVHHKSFIPHILSIDKIKSRAARIRSKLPSILEEDSLLLTQPNHDEGFLMLKPYIFLATTM